MTLLPPRQKIAKVRAILTLVMCVVGLSAFPAFAVDYSTSTVSLKISSQDAIQSQEVVSDSPVFEVILNISNSENSVTFATPQITVKQTRSVDFSGLASSPCGGESFCTIDESAIATVTTDQSWQLAFPSRSLEPTGSYDQLNYITQFSEQINSGEFTEVAQYPTSPEAPYIEVLSDYQNAADNGGFVEYTLQFTDAYNATQTLSWSKYLLPTSNIGYRGENPNGGFGDIITLVELTVSNDGSYTDPIELDAETDLEFGTELTPFQVVDKRTVLLKPLTFKGQDSAGKSREIVFNFKESDWDGDGYVDALDTEPYSEENWTDFDGDLYGDDIDPDIDNDGTLNAADAFDYDPFEDTDTDSDGIGNNADLDDDADGLSDEWEIRKGLDPLVSNIDIDSDADGYSDIYDALPFDDTEYLDTDDDDIGNVADPDDDNDGVPDEDDALPFMPGYYRVTDQGQILPDAEEWACVLDASNGLLWEVKTEAGLHNKSSSYTWYSEDDSVNGGDAGVSSGSESQYCDEYDEADPDNQCNTQAFAARVNYAKLCGLNSWSLPSKDQLLSLVNTNYTPVIDPAYFVDDLNSSNIKYWVNTTDENDAGLAFAVHFEHGRANISFSKATNLSVRLVNTNLLDFGHWDSDTDGISDSDEILLRSDPFDQNSPVVFDMGDWDGDGVINRDDDDDDNDGVVDSEDALPLNDAESSDFDNDGLGDNEDTDDDFDGYSDVDEQDNGTDPYNPESIPSDNDLDYISDLNDIDDDNDGIQDVIDEFPTSKFEWRDTDGDKIGDNADGDIDGDGIEDSNDPMPYTNEYTYLNNVYSRFVRLDKNGVPAPESATEWACILDTQSGLIWENKTDDGGLQDKDNLYYQGDHANDYYGAADRCDGLENCDTEAYLEAVNALNICGTNDWDYPLVNQVAAITDSSYADYLNTDYFNLNGIYNYEYSSSPSPQVWMWTYYSNSSTYPDIIRWVQDNNNNGQYQPGQNYFAPIKLIKPVSVSTLRLMVEESVNTYSPLKDSDRDGIPDADEIALGSDPFDSRSPYDNTQLDNDGDGVINILDEDDDNDGVADTEDDYPFDATQQQDSDYDGIPDWEDILPYDNTETVDTDLDGIGDDIDTDDDNDGIPDTEDTSPLAYELAATKQWQFERRFPNSLGLWSFNEVDRVGYGEDNLLYLLKNDGANSSITVINEAGHFIRQLNLGALLDTNNINTIDIEVIDETLWVYIYTTNGALNIYTFDELEPEGKQRFSLSDLPVLGGDSILQIVQAEDHLYLLAASGDSSLTDASIQQVVLTEGSAQVAASLNLTEFISAQATPDEPGISVAIDEGAGLVALTVLQPDSAHCLLVNLYDTDLSLLGSKTQQTDYCGTHVASTFSQVNNLLVLWSSTAGIHNLFEVDQDTNELFHISGQGISPYGSNTQGLENIDTSEYLSMASSGSRTVVVGQGFVDFIENSSVVNYLSARVLGQGIRTADTILLEGGGNMHVIDRSGHESLQFTPELIKESVTALPAFDFDWDNSSKATLYDGELGYITVRAGSPSMTLYQWGVSEDASFELDVSGTPDSLFKLGEELLLVWRSDSNTLFLSRFNLQFELLESFTLGESETLLTGVLTPSDMLLLFTQQGQQLRQWIWRSDFRLPAVQEIESEASIFLEVAPEEIVDVAAIDNLLLVGTKNDGVWQTDIYGNKLSKLNLRGYGAGSGNNVNLRAVGDELFVLDRNEYRLYKLKRTTQQVNAKAIIVAGGGPYPGNVLWTATLMNANYAYQALSGQGYSKENIRYFAAETFDLDGNGELDDFAVDFSKEGLENAITEWAADADSLVVYFVDHGGVDRFRMGADIIVDAAEVANWLDSWQAQSGSNLVMVYDACKSGSFLDELSSDGRIVMASTAADEDAYFLSNGAISFSAFFWQGVWNGQSLGETYEYTQSLITGNLELPQTPQISVNGEYNNTNLISDVYIGNAKGTEQSLPQIGDVTDTQSINSEQLTIAASDVTDADGIARVWAVIWPPLYGNSDAVAPVIDLPQVDLQLTSKGNYQYRYTHFNEEGTYRVAVYATDALGNTSEPKTFDVTVQGGVKRRAIIIEGGAGNAESMPQVHDLGETAYNALVKQGFDPVDIYYLAPALNGNYKNYYLNTLENVNVAFTTWADNSLDVAIYLVGEANEFGELVLTSGSNDEVLDHDTLETLANNLQDNITGTLTLIADVPYAGQVIGPLQDETGELKRIVLTGASEEEPAYWLSSKLPPFSKYFWRQVSSGADLRTAFRYASKALKYPLLKFSPQLNDDGSDKGNEKSDGYLARDYILGGGLLTAGDEPLIGDYEEGDEITLEPAQGLKALRLTKITSTSDLTEVVAHIVSPEDSEGNVSIDTIELSGLENGDYEAWYTFDKQGSYQVTFEATNVDGYVSLPMSIVVVQPNAPEDLVFDNQSPVLSLPDDLTVPMSQDGETLSTAFAAIAQFLNSATAEDAIDGTVAVSHDAPDTFGEGTTVVTFTAQDASGNTSRGSASITLSADTDGDGYVNWNDAFPTNAGVAVDTDGDGSPDAYLPTCDSECQQGITLDADDDNDGLSDEEELAYLLNPLLTDSDGDGIADVDELFDIRGRWQLSVSFDGCGSATDDIVLDISEQDGYLHVSGATQNALSADCSYTGASSNSFTTTYAAGLISDVQFLAIASHYTDAEFDTFSRLDEAHILIQGMHDSGTAVSASLSPASDTQSPDITAPASVVLAAQDASSGVNSDDVQVQQFLDSVSATDESDGAVDVTNNAPAIFPIGDTVVTFTASDAAGNTATATVMVTVSTDMDNDGYANWEDAFPTNGAIAVDSDGDGLADEYVANCDSTCQSKAVIDEDDDNDGIPDTEDAEPTNPRNAIARPSEAGDLIVPLGNDNAIPVRFAYEASSNTYSVTPVTTGNTVTFTGEYRKVWLYELPDMDGSGAYEYGLFGIRSDEGNEERLQLFIRDSETGAKVSILNWVDNWSQVSIVVLNDITGDGVTDFGLQGYLKAGYRPQLSLKNGLTNKGLGNVGFPNLWNSPTYMGFSDMTGDGVDEIALFGFIKRNDKPQVKVVDGSKPNRKLKAYTFPSKWEEVSWHNVGDYNGDGEDDWGLLGHAKSDGRWQLIVKDGTQPRGALAIYAWPNMSDTTLMQLADATGDGVKEIALGGLNTKGRWQLQIKDGQDRNNTVKNMTWANNRSQSSLHVIGDVDGDGKDELALMGMDSEGSIALLIKTSVDDYGSETTLELGSDWAEMPTISQFDTDGDGTPEWVAWGTGLNGTDKMEVLSQLAGASN